MHRSHTYIPTVKINIAEFINDFKLGYDDGASKIMTNMTEIN